ncbi:MAG: CaiB/BaiF CoA transferase family protein [Dehalococcoidia bacterium]
MTDNQSRSSSPLAGLRVLDLTVAWAGPYATMLLADLGAEVIRVENIHVFPSMTRGMQPRPAAEFIRSQIAQVGGYPDRDPGHRPWNRCPFFNVHARSKRSVTLDLRKEEGMSLFWRLVEISDGLIENNAPDTLEKLGITWERLRERNDQFILVRMPAFGSGPYAGYRALGTHLEAFLGQTMLRRYPDMDPSMNSTTFSTDFLGGSAAAAAFLMALLGRRSTARGCAVEVPQAQNGLALVADALIERAMRGQEPEARGNRDHSVIQGCYPCRGEDQWVVLRVETPEEWARLKAQAGQPELTSLKFIEVVTDSKVHDRVDAVLSEWTSTQDSAALADLLQGDGIIAGPVIDHERAYRDPHLADRQFFVRLENEDCGTHLYPGAAWHSLRRPVAFQRGPVLLGEDNEYVLRELLAISDAEYRRMERDGLIGTEYSLH